MTNSEDTDQTAEIFFDVIESNLRRELFLEIPVSPFSITQPALVAATHF